MSQQPPVKIIPRNVAAFRRGRAPQQQANVRMVAGNPVSTRLESAVGNCFPGLECDLRNLERRFFPFLETDIGEQTIQIASVDMVGVQAAGLAAAIVQRYRRIANDLAAGRSWAVRRLGGTFGPLGPLTLTISQLDAPSIGGGRRPPDAWTAVRMLTEGTEVTLELRGPSNATLQLTGNRMRYLDDNGALAEMFLPGELTQSLCSPWTHDFRDCGCYYWASNHPDIAMPPLPLVTPNDPRWNLSVPWERLDRTVDTLPAPATTSDPVEFRHNEINSNWQALNFVVGRREIVGPFSAQEVKGEPLASAAELDRHLRYAAGVELGVAHEYLAAAYSLRPPTGLPNPLRDDIRAAHAELMRIAIGEMRHIRAVNEVLRSLAPVTPFRPALQLASRLPDKLPGTFRPVQPRAATIAAIDDFIDIERPSTSVDGLYIRILATLERDGTDEQVQSVRTIMAEGGDHFATFEAIREWLGRHQPGEYLRSTNLARAPNTDPAHRALQIKYLALLQQLFRGYERGGIAGAPDVNAARTAMIGPNGIDGAAQAVATRGFLVTFDPIADPRFAAIDPP
jgi:Ferritin-like